MRIPSSLLWSLSLWQFLIAGTVSESVSVSDEFLSNSESQSHLRSRSLQAPVSDPSTVTTTTTTNSQSLQQQQQQQPPPLVVRTDLVRLVPFQVQIAIKDDTSPNEAELVSDILYEGGTLLTDTISDWMVASFAAKSTGPAGELLGIGNSTSFDSIALELVANSNSQGQIDGRVLNLVQVSFEGVSLWERRGVGTAPMEQDLVELMERATFLEDRKLRTDLQKTVNNLLYDLGIDDGDVEGDQSITIVDVRAYITPPGSGFQDGDKNGSGSGSNNDILLGGSSGKDSSETPAGNNNNRNSNSNSNANKNLEIIIIVAIVVACLAFALLVFAVCWAWRADRRDRQKPSSSSSARGSAGGGASASAGASSSNRKRRSVNTAAGKKRTYRAQTNSHDDNDNDNDDDETDGDNNGAANANTNAKTKANIRRGGSAKAQQGSSGRGLFSRKFSQKSAAASSSSAPAVSKASSNGSYPRVIGDTSRANADNEHEHEHDESTYNSPKGSRDQDDSVISSDISSSLSAYYKSNFHTGSGGNNSNGNSNSNGRTTGNGGGAKDFNDAASMSSMDSYGYSLDGYAPSLGPAQGGYPVGPLHAARDAPIPIGTSQDEQNAHDDDDDMGNIRQMMDDESIVDYEAEA